MSRSASVTVRVRIEPDGRTITVVGRDAWALQRLIEVGEAGVTPLDTPGPRWFGYVHKLRKAGLVIETIHEGHGDPFPGTHARYVLRSNVTVLDESDLAA
jgi:hypothetical protein